MDLEGLLVALAPMLVLIVAWAVFSRMGFTRQARNVGDILTSTQAQTAELQKVRQSLERIASALEANNRPLNRVGDYIR